MTLKEQLCKPFGGLKTETANELEIIVDNFTIEFTYWRLTTFIKNADQYTMKELLDIFKKERNL